MVTLGPLTVCFGLWPQINFLYAIAPLHAWLPRELPEEGVHKAWHGGPVMLVPFPSLKEVGLGPRLNFGHSKVREAWGKLNQEELVRTLLDRRCAGAEKIVD